MAATVGMLVNSGVRVPVKPSTPLSEIDDILLLSAQEIPRQSHGSEFVVLLLLHDQEENVSRDSIFVAATKPHIGSMISVVSVTELISTELAWHLTNSCTKQSFNTSSNNAVKRYIIFLGNVMILCTHTVLSLKVQLKNTK
jgi:hypothetical protein